MEFKQGSGGGVVARSTFQIADGQAQNIRIFSLPGDFILLAYGDDTATHLVEFSANGTQVASLTDPTTVTFSQVTSLGDGRVVVAYDNTDASHTSQFDTKIFDLRTTGLNINDGPSSGGGNNLNDGTDKYFAGTQFNDTVIGENNVNNTYYFVGQNATGQGASDTGPSDIFHGGTGGWNEAIFPDTIANYTIVGTISGNTITNIDPQQHHAGTLTVDQNVQALAFAPTHDPLPGADGSVEASGDTLLIFNPFAKAASIDAGATLEFGAANSGSVTFNSSTGILRLDSSATFSGQINGFAGDGTLSGSDQIDLRDINHSSKSVQCDLQQCEPHAFGH